MKYPNEIVSYVRKKTFSVDAQFSKRTEDKPLVVFDDTFSRFVMNVIADGKPAYMNIHIEDVSGMARKTDYAFSKWMDYKTRNTATTTAAGTSPAYTKKFVYGEHKGKTPVEVYLTEGKDALNAEYKKLGQNADKYEINKVLMNAIEETAKLAKEGKIEAPKEAPEAADTAPIEILTIGARPLRRKTREDGKSFCYEGSIELNLSQNYPVKVTVKNFYAPVVEKENGLLNISLAQKDKETEIVNTFVMTAEEWANVMDAMREAKENFKTTNFISAYKAAEAAAAEARSAYAKGGNPEKTA